MAKDKTLTCSCPECHTEVSLEIGKKFPDMIVCEGYGVAYDVPYPSSKDSILSDRAAELEISDCNDFERLQIDAESVHDEFV